MTDRPPRDEPADLDPADDATLWAGRLRAWPAAASPVEEESEGAPFEQTRMSARSAPADDTVRARPSGPAAPAPEHTEVRPATRREASGRIAAPAETPRNARVPTGVSREIYRPRAADPVIVPRSAPAAPPPAGPAPDPAAGERRARSRRVRLLVLTAIVVAAVAAAVVGVALLLTL